MEGFDEDVYTGANDGGEDNVQDDGMQYGFEGDSGVEPPSPPPLPTDGFLRSPMRRNIDMQTSEVYGGSPNAYNSRSPFADATGGGDDYSKPYDVAADDEGIFTSADGDGPLLPDPSQMREEGTAFREWRRQNMIYLEEKEKKEKESRNQIIAEAEEWKRKFYEKRAQTCETNKAQNREKEKLYHSQQEKLHKEADNQFWKTVADIIPREVPNIEKRRSKRDDEKKPSILVIQGPKPGKPTDMSRMRQILAKVKQNPPLHMMPPPQPEKDAKNDATDGKTGTPKASDNGKDKKDGGQGGSSEKPVTPPAKGDTPKTPKANESTANAQKTDA